MTWVIFVERSAKVFVHRTIVAVSFEVRVFLFILVVLKKKNSLFCWWIAFIMTVFVWMHLFCERTVNLVKVKDSASWLGSLETICKKVLCHTHLETYTTWLRHAPPPLKVCVHLCDFGCHSTFPEPTQDVHHVFLSKCEKHGGTCFFGR